ncbi:MAG: hypothetical protein LAT62_00850 [Natronospirillum sp.]|uniref:hypothetical protein n=1 Tax=Natronospirillum sp. TaxID=2812955 RepID=UPI0025ECADCA|nr:hypothetical protein [Natronospirillum sp.]MCH8550451.1 hypothetical protein [Natronospirillum sp.]
MNSRSERTMGTERSGMESLATRLMMTRQHRDRGRHRLPLIASALLVVGLAAGAGLSVALFSLY